MVTTLPAQPAEKEYSDSGVTLLIPKLGLQIPVVGVPLSPDGWDTTWLGGYAGYLEGSAFPTWNGNTVITGHVWSAQNQPGPFARIKQLSYGDLIQIQAWGQTYTYQVQETGLVSPYQVNSVLRHETLDWVTLLTCEGFQPEWNSYSFRRIVRAVLIDVQ
ncbi:MAG: sortase [Anaerolineales bacterium]